MKSLGTSVIRLLGYRFITGIHETELILDVVSYTFTRLCPDDFRTKELRIYIFSFRQNRIY